MSVCLTLAKVFTNFDAWKNTAVGIIVKFIFMAIESIHVAKPTTRAAHGAAGCMYILDFVYVLHYAIVLNISEI